MIFFLYSNNNIVENYCSFLKVPFDFTEEQSNVPCISEIIERKTGLESPIILLDPLFQIIKDTKPNRGEFFWGSNKKFYFISKVEWDNFLTDSLLKFKTISKLQRLQILIIDKT